MPGHLGSSFSLFVRSSNRTWLTDLSRPCTTGVLAPLTRMATQCAFLRRLLLSLPSRWVGVPPSPVSRAACLWSSDECCSGGCQKGRCISSSPVSSSATRSEGVGRLPGSFPVFILSSVLPAVRGPIRQSCLRAVSSRCEDGTFGVATTVVALHLWRSTSSSPW